MFFKVNMSAGVYFTGKNDDLRIGSSHFLPIADLPGKNPSQLIQRKLRNRILWVYHNREAVQCDGILSWFNAFFLASSISLVLIFLELAARSQVPLISAASPVPEPPPVTAMN